MANAIADLTAERLRLHGDVTTLMAKADTADGLTAEEATKLDEMLLAATEINTKIDGIEKRNAQFAALEAKLTSDKGANTQTETKSEPGKPEKVTAFAAANAEALAKFVKDAELWANRREPGSAPVSLGTELNFADAIAMFRTTGRVPLFGGPATIRVNQDGEAMAAPFVDRAPFDTGIREMIARVPRIATDLIEVRQTDSRTLWWVEQIARINGVTTVVEPDDCDLPDPASRKPHSSIDFAPRTSQLVRLAHMMCASDEALKFGGSQVRDLIESEGPEMMLDELERQLIVGDPSLTPTELQGWFNTPGIQIHPTSGNPIRDLRESITQALIVGGVNINAFLLQPFVVQELDLATATDGRYLAGDPFAWKPWRGQWGVTVWQSQHAPDGEGLAMDSTKFKIFAYGGIEMAFANQHADHFSHDLVDFRWTWDGQQICSRPAAVIRCIDLPQQ